jgi:hypothetical protein
VESAVEHTFFVRGEKVGITTIAVSYQGNRPPACVERGGETIRVEVVAAQGECPKVEKLRGAFGPTQGVFQDDPFFPDMAGKQITQQTPTSYTAELPMIKDRPALVIGVDRPVGGPALNSRDEIFIEGEANGADIPVKFRFTLIQGSERSQIYESEKPDGTLPLGGDCGDPRPFRVKLPARNGIPLDKPFFFTMVGRYTIEAELVREDGTPTGLKVTVAGEVVETHGPKTHFVPVLLSESSEEERAQLTDAAQELADDSGRFIPELFPLAPGGLPTATEKLSDLTGLIQSATVSFWESFIAKLHGVTPGTRAHRDLVERLRSAIASAELIRRLAPSGQLRNLGRIVGVVKDSDLKEVMLLPQAAALALSQKVVFVRSRSDFTDVAHEFVHTLPFLWSDKEIERDCKTENYHNREMPIAHGILITERSRQRQDARVPLMGPIGGTNWITQCTYWHLIEQLRSPPDPRVILVQGRLGRTEDRVMGELLPAYQFESVTDLAAGQGGDWAIVLRNSFGLVVGRFPFTPVWRIPIDPLVEPLELSVLAFAYRVPDLPGVARIDLVGPGGVLLDSKRYSRTAPSVVITIPGVGAAVQTVDGKVRVEWRGMDADGDTLLYTVVYSPNGGETWLDVVFEQTETAIDVPVDERGSQHLVKVIVTDGTRSREAIVRFSPVKDQ